MYYDNYAFRQSMLLDILRNIEQATNDLEQAKRIAEPSKKIAALQAARNLLQQHVQAAVGRDPHVAYLWFEARDSELDNEIRERWRQQSIKFDFQALTSLQLAPSDDTFGYMPLCSFLVRIPFTLRKPYLSKDDKVFHLLDNPVRKEKLFQWPMVAASSWKGALRSAMVRQLTEWWSELPNPAHQQRKLFVQRRFQLARLFGNEKGLQIDDQRLEQLLDKVGDARLARWYRRAVRRYLSASDFFAGRLHFFPTFFDRVGFEVINPHDRQRGVSVRGPILLECVPQGATGTLSILYVPSGLAARAANSHSSEVAQDLEALAQGLQAMLTVYGFGAKTSAGFGVVGDQLAGQGTLLIRAALGDDEGLTEPSLPMSVRQFLRRYPNEDFSLKPKEWRKKYNASSRDQDLYKEAREQYRAYQQQLAAWETTRAERKDQPTITAYTFTTFGELQEQARQLAKQLRKGDCS